MNSILKMSKSEMIYSILFLIFLIILGYCIYHRKDLIKIQELKDMKYNEEFENLDKAEFTMYHVDWCGYCKKLYESGELQKAAKTHLVIVVD